MKSFFYALIFLFLASCISDDTPRYQKEDLKKIRDLENEILELVNSSVCNGDSQCAYIAFGSKPCGGPWSYLVYSSSINVSLLVSKVEEYNKMQNDYNLRYNAVSDCMFVTPPVDLICDDGKCIGIYNQIQ